MSNNPERSIVDPKQGDHIRSIDEDEGLRRSEEQLRLIIDAIPVMAWTLRPDGVVDFLNQRWIDYSGLSLEHYRADPTGTIHPDDIARVMDQWHLMMAAGKGYDDEMRLRRSDGAYRWFLVRTAPVRDEKGHVVRWCGVSTDIEDRKRVEQGVRERERLWQQVLDALPVGVSVTDLRGDILLNNPESTRIWGRMIAEGAERYAASMAWWHGTGQQIEQSEWPSVRAYTNGQTTINELIDISTFDGQFKTIQNSSAPIRNGGEEIVGAVVVNQDVTERVHAEAALRESTDRLHHLSRRMLEVQEEERRHISRELHDEFGQLLATTALHLHAARNVAGEAARSHLDECAALIRRAGEQVRGLALQLRPTMLETAGLDAALRWLADEHRQTGVVIDVQGHANVVSGDLAIACFRVVQEALTNVVRHAQARHVSIELTRTETDLELVIHDDGVGFDVVSTLEQAARCGRLGLLGMRERVQILGGRLAVNSEPGCGTHVRISFPLTEDEG